jgi:hypothetical protein
MDGIGSHFTTERVKTGHSRPTAARASTLLDPPLAAGLQDQAANRLELLWLRARVVSVKEKARKTCQVRVGKTSASEPLTETLTTGI